MSPRFDRARRALALTGLVALGLCGCAVTRSGLAHVDSDGSVARDGGPVAAVDLGGIDAGPTDLGSAPSPDAGMTPMDLGPPDLGVDFGVDFGVDLGPPPPPCAGACTAAQLCVAGTCVTCGGVFQSCCEMSRCTSGLVCALGLGCVSCGGNREPCCAGDMCGASRSCTLGFCL